ncbi:thiazolylpeptide-type bacteriocin [Streptomyces cinereoruber]|uniref:thiazolylpeptide-type bacteriocin n=1 Tax=Streptomyces cinereoruber TaxID=67260 RepID=UPI00362AE477
MPRRIRKEKRTSVDGIENGDDANEGFEKFDVDERETPEVAQGVALPERGASSDSIGTSSSSTCSAC